MASGLTAVSGASHHSGRRRHPEFDRNRPVREDRNGTPEARSRPCEREAARRSGGAVELHQWGGHAVPLLVEGHGYHRHGRSASDSGGGNGTGQGRTEPDTRRLPKTDHTISRGTSSTDTLSSGTSAGFLNQGEKLVSRNGKYEAEMQSDGNFVIYTRNRQRDLVHRHPLKGTSPYKLAMQADANLVRLWKQSHRLGQRSSEPRRRRSSSLCRMTAISSSTTTTHRFVWEAHRSSQ